MRGNLSDARLRDLFVPVPLGLMWKEYQEAAVKQKIEKMPLEPPAGIAIKTDRGDFACGVCLYPTPYRMVIGEYLVTNPDLPMWERHVAVVCAAESIKHYALCSGQDLWFPIRLAGIKKAAERAGLRTRGTEIYGIGAKP